MKLLLLCLLLGFVSGKRILSAVQRDGKIVLVDGRPSGELAWGSFQDDIFKDGWAYLEISTNHRKPDDLTAYAAGAIEAELTRDLMDKQFNNLYKNYCDNRTEYCSKLGNYITEQVTYLYDKADQNRAKSPFWNQVSLMMQQLSGLDDQYEQRALDATNKYNFTSKTKTMYYNWEGDLLDLESALKRTPDKNSLNQIGRCSALIKQVDNDIYFSHVAWFTYSAMLRIQKKYNFRFHEINHPASIMTAGSTISMSSYPGKLISLDDFYLMSSGLAVTETTNDNANNDLWSKISPRSVPTWLRAMAANKVSKDAKTWVKNFDQENSGTYNNQWMIFDYKRFNKTATGGEILSGAFYVLEQMPTLIHAADKTDLLKKQGYWSSFNIPYFEDVYNISGMVPLYEKYGDYYSHDQCPRAKIFRRDHVNVKTTKQMIALMRYNDYKNDPASKCNCTPPYNPTYAISSRYDLVDPNGHYDIPRTQRRAAGGIDMKMTSYDRFWRSRFVAINGPTWDTQPVFEWSKSGFNNIPEGHPDMWDFKPVEHRWRG